MTTLHERLIMGRLSYDQGMATPFRCHCGRVVAGGALGCLLDPRRCPFEAQRPPQVGKWGVLWAQDGEGDA